MAKSAFIVNDARLDVPQLVLFDYLNVTYLIYKVCIYIYICII